MRVRLSEPSGKIGQTRDTTDAGPGPSHGFPRACLPQPTEPDYGTSRLRQSQQEDAVIALLLALVFVVPLLILGLVALLRARPEDIPDVMHALARWGRR
jgi:hypothetical protein